MGPFYKSIVTTPPVHEPEKAEKFLAELEEAVVAHGDLARLAGALGDPGPLQSLLRGVFGASPYLTGLALRNPEGLEQWLSTEPAARLDALGTALEQDMAAASNREEAMRLLRRYKQQIALGLALADIGGVLDVEQVTRGLSDAAGHAISTAVRFLFARAAQAGTFISEDDNAPDATSGYFVLGLGKLGAFELNYSSDVDLIIFYDRTRGKFADGTERTQFFIRMTRDLVSLLQDRTADGYVFRTDLRLRPDPGATQVALSTDAGLSYYESFGQNWERAALIKARVVAGDAEAGEAFLEQLEPFVWRKYLDYASIADIHAMKRRVHEFKGHGEIAVAGHDVKLGRGGIREIEFFVQTQQLIAGGRQPDLRGRATLDMLRALSERNWIDKGDADELAGSYRFLRNLEHRLQMVADEQTHKLPGKREDIERIAHFAGFEDVESFADELVSHLTRVQRHYDALFDKLPADTGGRVNAIFRGDDADPEFSTALSEIGFSDVEGTIAMVRAWRSGRYAAMRSERARERLDEFLTDLLTALGATADPDGALVSFDRFVAELPAGVQLFSLLGANPSLLRLIADIMGTAPRLARVLGRRARVLDAVLDPGFFGDMPPPDALSELVRQEVGAANDYQDCLDRARVVGTEQAFLIGVRVLSGTITAQQAGDAYAMLAENLIAALHAAVLRELDRTHGTVPGGMAAVIAMGKLGGYEMTAASDLDLITVYDFDAQASMSSGAKPLAPGQYFARFTQRLISALTAPTAEGALYEVDMRLRPSGNAGPVSTHIEGFVDYQENTAWTWEHLALTRARVIAGPDALKSRIEDAIHSVLCAERDRARLAEDVQEMRAKIAKEKGTDDIWDIKQARGGLVDLEFIAQFLQLVHASEHPAILDQNTHDAFEKLSAAGLISADDAEILIPAARLYHDLTQLLRLCLDRPFDPESASPGLKQLLARASECKDFQALEAHLARTLKGVHGAFDRIVT